jgi:hypothetical protein
MSTETQLAVHTAPKASDQLASFLGIEKGMMLETLKAQCFKGKRPDEVSDAQLAAFVSTANVLQVNPLVPGMLYAYPERNGGITPILGPDGVFKKLDEMIASGKLTGFECDVACDKDGKPVSATALIHRGSNNQPAKYTAYFSEWVVGSNPNWQTRPRHMIWVRAIKQAARQVIHGLPMDSDEYEISKMANVTGTASEEPAVERPAPKPRAAKGAATVRENAPKTVDAEVVDVSSTPAAAPATPEPVKEAPKPLAPVAPPPAPEPVAEKPVESFADAAAATAEPAPAPQKAESVLTQKPSVAIEQRALLKPDEAITVLATVEEFKVVTGMRGGQPHPYVTARIVSPELRGEVSQTDGGILEGKTPLPVWQLDRPVRITVRGKKYKNGALLNVVESITEASAADQQASGDEV